MRLEYLPHLNCDAGACASAENLMWKNLSVPNCGAGAGAEKRKRKKPPPMTMEMYLKFLESNKKMDLVYHHLNQIIGLHGFKKLHKQHKGVLMDFVSSMELIDPARSTVSMDGVSSDALLSVEEVVNDLSELQWQETCTTSMETLNDVVYHHHHHHHHHQLRNSPHTGGSCSASPLSSSEAEHPKRKRRLRRLRDIMEDGDDNDVVSGDSAAGCSSPSLVVAKWLRTKERKMRLKRTNFGKIGWGGGGILDDTSLPAWVEVENQLWPSF